MHIFIPNCFSKELLKILPLKRIGLDPNTILLTVIVLLQAQHPLLHQDVIKVFEMEPLQGYKKEVIQLISNSVNSKNVCMR